MTFKLGDAIDKYGMTYKSLARKVGRTDRTVYTDAYQRGVRRRFVAMAYAYALDCDYREIMEPARSPKNEGWDEPCLPGCEL